MAWTSTSQAHHPEQAWLVCPFDWKLQCQSVCFRRCSCCPEHRWATGWIAEWDRNGRSSAHVVQRSVCTGQLCRMGANTDAVRVFVPIDRGSVTTMSCCVSVILLASLFESCERKTWRHSLPFGSWVWWRSTRTSTSVPNFLTTWACRGRRFALNFSFLTWFLVASSRVHVLVVTFTFLFDMICYLDWGCWLREWSGGIPIIFHCFVRQCSAHKWT